MKPWAYPNQLLWISLPHFPIPNLQAFSLWRCTCRCCSEASSSPIPTPSSHLCCSKSSLVTLASSPSLLLPPLQFTCLQGTKLPGLWKAGLLKGCRADPDPNCRPFGGGVGSHVIPQPLPLSRALSSPTQCYLQWQLRYLLSPPGRCLTASAHILLR